MQQKIQNPYLSEPMKNYKDTISNNNSNLILSFNSKKGSIYREINKEIPSKPEKFEINQKIFLDLKLRKINLFYYIKKNI